MRIAIIGDVHGCYESLNELLNVLIKKFEINSFYFVGDLIDRGPYSKEVIDILLKLDYDKHFLLGNHEDMMLDFLDGELRYDNNLWFDNGGMPTLKSFLGCDFTKREGDLLGCLGIRRYFDDYLHFLNDFKEYLVIKIGDKNFFISHAGIYNFNKPPEKQYDGLSDTQKLQKYPYIWARNCDFSKKKYYDFIIIHGHTPLCSLGLTDNYKTPYINKNGKDIISINLDTGCVYGYALSAMVIDENGDFSFESVDCAE